MDPHLQRRYLLLSGLGAAFSATVQEPTRAEAPTSPSAGNPPLRIGFLGCCHSHALDKLEVVRRSAEYELVGVCEQDPVASERCKKLGIALLSQTELLRRCEVVAVESAVQDHARHARIALEAGKHIHLEKPPAETFEAFQALVALAKQKKLIMQMGYMWRYHPGINQALHAARCGWLGQVYLVRGTIHTLIGPERRPQWGRFPGGVLFELGSHLIDVMIRLLGRPARIHSVLKTHGPFHDTLADNTVAVFEFPRALGILSASTLQHNAQRYRSLEILGTQGTAVVRPIEPPELTIDLVQPAGPYHAGIQSVPLPRYQRYAEDFADLARAVRGGRLSVTPEEDLQVQEALIQASGQ